MLLKTTHSIRQKMKPILHIINQAAQTDQILGEKETWFNENDAILFIENGVYNYPSLMNAFCDPEVKFRIKCFFLKPDMATRGITTVEKPEATFECIEYDQMVKLVLSFPLNKTW